MLNRLMSLLKPTKEADQNPTQSSGLKRLDELNPAEGINKTDLNAPSQHPIKVYTDPGFYRPMPISPPEYKDPDMRIGGPALPPKRHMPQPPYERIIGGPVLPPQRPAPPSNGYRLGDYLEKLSPEERPHLTDGAHINRPMATDPIQNVPMFSRLKNLFNRKK